uniref:Uncharacterized protein n=1 Tax=Lactuca sativa TaxID=4236 RepID=A0A9R1XTU2_LACSA|nr:hypothetical protein LSAT_V11C100026670 [Lactuca sativa]
MFVIAERKKYVTAMLRRSSIGGSTNPMLFRYEVTDQMKNWHSKLGKSLLHCMGVIILHNGKISMNICRGCVSCHFQKNTKKRMKSWPFCHR